MYRLYHSTEKPTGLSWTFEGPGGAVKVVRRKTVELPDGTECLGLWNEETRKITLQRDLAGPAGEWVGYHELAHVAISDAGLTNTLSAKEIEMICDAMASALVQFRKSGVFDKPEENLG